MGRQTRQARRAQAKVFGQPVGIFRGWLSDLKALPPDAEEWNNVDSFLEDLTDIMAHNTAERLIRQSEQIRATVKDTAKAFRSELRYLETELTLSDSIGHPLSPPYIVTEAIALVDTLRSQLQEYHDVRPQAPTLTEEKRRATRRAELEQAILASLAKWNNLQSAADSAAPDLNAANDTNEPATVSPFDHAALKDRFDKLQHKYDQAQAVIAERTRERDQAHERVRNLRASLSTFRKSPDPVEEDDAKLPSSPPQPETPGVASVSEAVAAAEANFPDSLTIALNSASNESTPFQRPNEVYAALEWLATDYYDLRMNPPGTEPEFDRRLKEVCSGWSYSPKQSDTAKNKYRIEYETQVDGKVYMLDTHIAKGTKGDPQHMIRIAFDWDSERQQVIVGYIGPHQRTQAS